MFNLIVEESVIKVTKGLHAGRIGYYDDDNDESAIIYFGNILLTSKFFIIPYSYIQPVTTDDLLKRSDELFHNE